MISDRKGPYETDALYFVDTHTYRPVRIVIKGAEPILPSPVFLVRFAAEIRVQTLFRLRTPPTGPWVFDFTAYRYLPSTAANRKLANVRAQHPHAPIE